MVSGGPAVAGAIKEPTSTIPIVTIGNSDPVDSGLVASLARPGGNITGLSTLAPEIAGKRLELLKEIVPKLSGVADERYLNRQQFHLPPAYPPCASSHFHDDMAFASFFDKQSLPFFRFKGIS
jgi:hypothetical protein